MKILFYLNRSKENKQGYVPIYIRITIQGERAEMSSGIYCHPDHWDNTTKKIKLKDPGTEASNLQLSHLEADIRIAKMELERQAKAVTAVLLRDYVQRQPEKEEKVKAIGLIELFGLMIKEKEKEVEQGLLKKVTIEQYLSRFNLVTKYLDELPGKNIAAENVTKKFANEFMNWLKEKNYHHNYIIGAVGIIRRTLNYGLSEELLTVDRLRLLKLNYQEKEKIVIITPEEVKTLHGFKFIGKLFNDVKNRFLIQYFTGVANCDVKKIKKENIQTINDQGRERKIFNFHRQKTERHKTLAMPPLCKEAEEILEQYDYSLPEIPYNTYLRVLKEVAAMVGITINLTSHVGRGSYAQNKINSGYSFDTVAAFLGQKDTKVLKRHYARVSNTSIINEMNVLEQRENRQLQLL